MGESVKAWSWYSRGCMRSQVRTPMRTPETNTKTLLLYQYALNKLIPSTIKNRVEQAMKTSWQFSKMSSLLCEISTSESYGHSFMRVDKEVAGYKPVTSKTWLSSFFLLHQDCTMGLASALIREHHLCWNYKLEQVHCQLLFQFLKRLFYSLPHTKGTPCLEIARKGSAAVEKLGMKCALRPTVPRKLLTSVSVVEQLDSSTAWTLSSPSILGHWDHHEDYLVHWELTEGEVLVQPLCHSVEFPVVHLIVFTVHYQVICNTLFLFFYDF